MKIQEVASKYEKYQVEMRRYFHQYPEVSGKEYETSKKIKEELDKIEKERKEKEKKEREEETFLQAEAFGKAVKWQ